MTRIAFRRTGGVIGPDVDLILDFDGLPHKDAQHLEDLVINAHFFNLPENLIALTTSREFQYTVTVHGTADKHTVRLTDTSASSSLRDLVDELIILAVSKKYGLL
jgi:hypothetical protein